MRGVTLLCTLLLPMVAGADPTLPDPLAIPQPVPVALEPPETPAAASPDAAEPGAENAPTLLDPVGSEVPPAPPAPVREQAPPKGPPGLGSTEEDVYVAHGVPFGKMRYRERLTLMYGERGFFEMEEGVVIRMKWDGQYYSPLPKAPLAPHPLTMESQRGRDDRKRSPGPLLITPVTNAPPARAVSP